MRAHVYSFGPCLGICEFEVLCSFPWLWESHRQDVALIKLFHPNNSLFPCFPDGYYVLFCFRVRIFISAHCLDMILSNTSFIYTFACFWPFWMKNQVFSCKQNISKEVAPGMRGSAPGRPNTGPQLIFPLFPCIFVACVNQMLWLWGVKLSPFAASVFILNRSSWVQTRSDRPAQPKVP